MKFSKKYLMQELDLPYENCLVNNIIDTSRWSVIHEIVFEDKGKFYQTSYSEGATECQDESPWEYEEEVDCIEVELKEQRILKWVPKEENKC